MEVLEYDMQCTCPTFAVMRDGLKGKKELFFGYSLYETALNNPRSDFKPILLPCGKCLSCKMRKAKDWSIRAVHEAQLHDENCFVTLTYDDDHLPKDMSVSIRDLQLFFKRLRKELSYYDRKVRYLACGEYGSRNGRPHYHLLLFGFVPGDNVLCSTGNLFSTYSSALISRLWPYGFNVVGSLTEKSAAYVARYTVKKAKSLDGEREDGRTPEFITCSRRPGLGTGWIEKFFPDVYNYDYVVMKNGAIARPPRFYDKWLSLNHEKLFDRIKSERQLFAENHVQDISALHIKTIEEIMQIRTKKLVRNLDDSGKDFIS